MAVACKDGELGHDDFYGAQLFEDVAYHEFEGITVHDDEGPRLVTSLGNKRVLVLRNHGMLVVGSDVLDAFRWMWTLQRACEVQIAADGLRTPNRTLTDDIRRASARDARAFEPREKLDRMLFLSVLRETGVDAASLL
jgi:ribulose-5-phosphate 4-epimerase/fuculose-1-phosphate aldolase